MLLFQNIATQTLQGTGFMEQTPQLVKMQLSTVKRKNDPLYYIKTATNISLISQIFRNFIFYGGFFGNLPRKSLKSCKLEPREVFNE